MKSIANRLFLFAAAALSLGTVAYGQSTLTAAVPFAFRTPGGTTSAGHYTVRFDDLGHGNGNVVQIQNRETRRSLLNISRRLEAKAHPIAPRLVFRCGEAGCRLAEIWTPEGGFSIPAGHVWDPEYVASVPLVESRN